MPDAVEVAVPFAKSDFAKAAFLMKRAACMVPGHDLSLQRPVALAFGVGDHPIEQGPADSFAARRPAYVNADLSDAGSASCVGNGGEGGPARDDAIFYTRDQPPDRQVPGIPGLPARRVRHEGGQSGREAFAIDRAHLIPVAALHGVDRKGHTGSLGVHIERHCKFDNIFSANVTKDWWLNLLPWPLFARYGADAMAFVAAAVASL